MGSLLIVVKFWYLLVFIGFVRCAYIDWQTRKIPNRITYPLLLISLVVTLVAGMWPTAIWGGLLAGGFLLVPRLLSGPGRAGMGDVKLSALGGLLLGPQLAIYALLLSMVAALVILLPLMLLKRLRWRDAVPFGPYLAIGFGYFLLQFILSAGIA